MTIPMHMYAEPNCFDVYIGVRFWTENERTDCMSYVLTVPAGQNPELNGIEVWVSRRNLSVAETYRAQEKATRVFSRISREKLERLCSHNMMPSSEPIT